MYNVSEAYREKINSNVREVYWYGNIQLTDGTKYEFDSSNLKQGSTQWTREICSSQSLEIGTTCSSELKIAFMLDAVGTEWYLNGTQVDRYNFFNAEIKLYFRLFYDEMYEDVPCGTFYVSDPVRSRNVLTCTAYDKMLNFDKDYMQTTALTAYRLLEDACKYCDVELGMTEAELAEFPNGTREPSYLTPNLVSTWRDVVSAVAAFLCAFAYIGRDNKLYLKSFSMNPVVDISDDMRYSSQISDYETYYDSVVATINQDGASEIVSVGQDLDGLTYDLGANPLFMYGIYDQRYNAMLSFIYFLNTMKFTPFTAEFMCDPSLDIGDTVSLSGGASIGGKVAPLTSITVKINGAMSVASVGDNTRLQKSESALDRELRNLASKEGDEISYYIFTNTDPITIMDGGENAIANIRYVSVKDTTVIFDCEIRLTAETSVTSDSDYDTYTDLIARVSYEIDGELLDFHPTETYQDGEHILNLVYKYKVAQNTLGNLIVYMKCTGGTVKIKEGDSNAYIYGMGLGAGTGENPQIDVLEFFGDGIDVGSIKFLGGIRDEYSAAAVKPFIQGFSEVFKPITIDGSVLLGTFTEIVSDNTGIFISTSTGSNYYTTDCSVSNNTFVGKGSVKTGTAGYLMTVNVVDIQSVKVNSYNAVYQVSFDEGETWKGYSDGAWVTDYTMQDYELQNVPSAAWSGEVILKALIELSATVTSISIIGGHINA